MPDFLFFFFLEGWGQLGGGGGGREGLLLCKKAHAGLLTISSFGQDPVSVWSVSSVTLCCNERM